MPALTYSRENPLLNLGLLHLDASFDRPLARTSDLPSFPGLDRRGDWQGVAVPGLAYVRQTSSPTEGAPDQLVQDVLAGDEQAAERLMERLYPTVLKTVRCHLPRRTSEEDLVQTIFSRVFSRLRQFSGQVPIEHWVSRIAVNTCINQLKHETVRREVRMSDLTEEEEAVVERLASTTSELPDEQGAAAHELVETLLARLKPEERLVIVLLYLEERSVKEISHLTGWSASLVKVKAFRSRQKMRHLWDNLLKQRFDQ